MASKNSASSISLPQASSFLYGNVVPSSPRVARDRQLATLDEIKNGQAENFSRMWNITLHAINGTIHNDNAMTRLQSSTENVLCPSESQKTKSTLMSG
ncbi:MAG: hypothetical protein FWC50_10685 [Planctomycetaceae bacterium]|nr:hypothetical protein [Planctomycetaceae bacterium]